MMQDARCGICAVRGSPDPARAVRGSPDPALCRPKVSLTPRKTPYYKKRKFEFRRPTVGANGEVGRPAPSASACSVAPTTDRKE